MLSSAALAEKNLIGRAMARARSTTRPAGCYQCPDRSLFGERQRAAGANFYEPRPRWQVPAGLWPGRPRRLPATPDRPRSGNWRRLDRDVVFYPVPQDVVVRIGVPPVGYRYVRVLNDVLMVAIGTNMGAVKNTVEELMR